MTRYLKKYLNALQAKRNDKNKKKNVDLYSGLNIFERYN